MERSTLTPNEIYQKVHSILSSKKLSPHIKNKIEIKKEISSMTAPLSYESAVINYLQEAIKMADPDAKKIFWELFYEDLQHLSDKIAVNNFYISYIVLGLEGLYDMIWLDHVSSMRGVNAKTPRLSDLSYKWVRSISDHAENEGKPVLIIGATGTSKEAVAAAIHRLSTRRENSYVRINCAAIPDNLIESELFGYEKGAFTGASASKNGLIEEATGGTLFLDEIGKTSLSFQAKILRLVQDKQYRRLGSTKDNYADVRITAAIQCKDLEDENHFLPDLKYRLGFPYCIEMPTLKERLAYFEGCFANEILQNSLNVVLRKMGMRDRMLSFKIADSALELLRKHDYKGNYRELENVLMAAVYSAKRKEKYIIQPEDLELLRSVPEAENESRNNIRLRDIFDYANKIGASIIETKIREIIDRGSDIKTTLANEYSLNSEVLTESQYIQFTKKIHTVTGKRINAFKK